MFNDDFIFSLTFEDKGIDVIGELQQLFLQ